MNEFSRTHRTAKHRLYVAYLGFCLVGAGSVWCGCGAGNRQLRVEFSYDKPGELPERVRRESPNTYLLVPDAPLLEKHGASAQQLAVVALDDGTKALDWRAPNFALGYRVASTTDFARTSWQLAVEMSIHPVAPGARVALRVGRREVAFCETANGQIVVYTPELYPSAGEFLGMLEPGRPFTMRFQTHFESAEDWVDGPSFGRATPRSYTIEWEARDVDSLDGFHVLFWTPSGTHMRLYRLAATEVDPDHVFKTDRRSELLPGAGQPADLTPCLGDSD